MQVLVLLVHIPIFVVNQVPIPRICGVQSTSIHAGADLKTRDQLGCVRYARIGGS